MTDVPHFAFPFRLAHGSFAVVEQDSLDEIEQSVIVLLKTPPGSRLELPAYGAPETLFVTDIDHGGAAAAVEVWEPRARILLRDAPDRFDNALRAVHADGKLTGQ